MNQPDNIRNRRSAVEWLTRPFAAEVPPLRQVERRLEETLDGSVFVGFTWSKRATRTPQRPADAFRRVLETLLKPTIERCPEQPFRLPFREHPEQRIDTRFHRPLTQQVGAEAVDRADVRLLEVLHRTFEALDRRLVAR